MIFHSFQKPIPYLDYLAFQERSRKKRRESLLFLEHPPTITAGVNSKSENLLYPVEFLRPEGVDYIPVSRGGDHTGHEPGQLVVYLHTDLGVRGMGVGDFLREIQTGVIETVDRIWGISLVENRTSPGLYWAENPQKKVVSLGVYFKSFFTSFGFALNLDNSCKIFRYIHPCGIGSDNMMPLNRIGADPARRAEFIRSYAEFWRDCLTKKYPAKNGKNLRWV